jgi:ankyrin repeat protein
VLIYRQGLSDVVIYIDRKPQAGDSYLINALKRRDLDGRKCHSNLRETTDANGYTPLQIAAHFGYEQEVKLLVDHGANLEAKTVRSRTALGMAILARQLKTIKLLIDLGADTTVVDDRNSTLLHYACRTQSFAIVTALLDALPETGLAFNLTGQDQHGHTALAKACLSGDITIIEILLRRGADPNITELYNGNKISLVQRLQPPLRQTEIIQLLLKYRLDLNAKNDYGYTVLHSLARKGEGRFCLELIRLGADPKALTRKKSDTVLHVAVRNFQQTALEVLLASGVEFEVDAMNDERCTALYLAAGDGQAKSCRSLLSHGAIVDIRCRTSPEVPGGFTALRSASVWGHTDVVKILTEAGASLEQISDGATALYVAAAEGHLDVCHVLVDAGAKFNFTHAGGNTVLSIAARKGHVEVVRYLLSRGARAWPRSKTGAYLDAWNVSVSQDIRMEVMSTLLGFQVTRITLR